ncbi:MAG: methylated-DNA--[protein]-cysteine S-methyltransferase [Propionibacteriales bacterium]|nr:methylated-DNA--[protein]-cysteine S-methyltransferase [Propionibacteriales bacterium]
MASPVGPMRLAADEGAIIQILFVEPDARVSDPAEGVDPLLDEARRQLGRYFAGELREFELPFATRGTTFQRSVWSELAKIPFGATSSYGEIARRLGLPMGASRAVGTANGANPIAIVIPCHRVIGADGKLIGYAGGLERKRFLLRHESGGQPQGALFAW